jgi:endoglucanase
MEPVNLRTRRLWVNPDTQAAQQARDWRTSNPAGAKIMDQIAAVPCATWLTTSSTGGWVDSMLDKAGDEIALFVAYNIPARDLSAYSAGGATSEGAYRSWCDNLASGIQGRPCIVALEPDSLPHAPRMSTAMRDERFRCLNYAIDRFVGAGAYVFMDVGDHGWVRAEAMADAARRAGVERAHGVISNVAHFRFVKDEDVFCNAILDRLAVPHLRYLVDSSRAGRGPREVRPGEEAAAGWASPDNAGYGARPTLRRTGAAVVRSAGLVWCKQIGSDGEREGAPKAGQPFPQYGVRLWYRALPRFPAID